MPKTFGKLGTRVRASRRPHPEERARRRRSANLARACARLEGLILRSAHVEDVRQTSNAVRASRRPHPEERARRRRPANFERACARLEGLILRSAHAEDVRQTWHARARVSKASS